MLFKITQIILTLLFTSSIVSKILNFTIEDEVIHLVTNFPDQSLIKILIIFVEIFILFLIINKEFPFKILIFTFFIYLLYHIVAIMNNIKVDCNCISLLELNHYQMLSLNSAILLYLIFFYIKISLLKTKET